jgi:hypothetical protein
LNIDLAIIKEQEGAESGVYPPDWPRVAREVKARADWKCERCNHPNDYQNGYTLTVHHLDGNKWNLELWNLAALCQRCHLHIQNKVDFYRGTLTGLHSPWMAVHVQGYNDWASRNGKPLLSFNGLK